MRFPELPAPNTVIEVSAQDDEFNLVDVFFVAERGIAKPGYESLIPGYLVRSDYSHDDDDFGRPYTMNLLTHVWQYIDSPATSRKTPLPEQPLVLSRRGILNTAAEMISTDRQESYGDAHDGFSLIGRYWGATLRIGDIEPEMVALMMAQVKIARLTYSAAHQDSWVDAAGYIALGGEIAVGAQS